MRRLLSAGLALLLALPAAAITAPEPAGEALLRSARMWEIKHRPDLQRLALEKYLLAHPDDNQALHALGELEIRSSRFDIAQKLIDRLKAGDADNATARDLSDAYRIATRDRLQMATINRLLQTSRYPEAVAALRQLFPNGAPGGQLGIDYYRVIDSSSPGWAEADRGLRQLLRDNPDDPKFIMALANHLSRRDTSRAEALRMIAALREREDTDPVQLKDNWRSSLSRLPDDASALKPLGEFLALYPDDEAAKLQLARVQRAEAERQRRLKDPVFRLLAAGIADYDAGRLGDAEAKLLQARALRPAEAEVAGNLGRVRLRQGRHAEAAELFETAARGDKEGRSKWQSLARTARFWRQLRAADAATDAGNLAQARTDIQAALKIQPRDPDGLSALADNALRRGDAASAEKIYREALARDATHEGALRGLARLMSQTGRRAQALAMFETLRKAHPKDARDLDSLRAAVLRDEADAALAAGRSGQALRGLEAAQQTDPANPWIRFDLARLYQKLGLPRQARELMAAGVERAPDDADARYAYSLLLSGLDEDDAALRNLLQIAPERRSDSMNALLQRLRIGALRRRAAQLARAADSAGAAADMQQAEVLAGEDLELLDSVAAGWIELGQPQRGLALLDGWAQRHQPLAAADRMVLARNLNRAHREPELAQAIAQLRADSTLPAADRETLSAWELDSTLRQADALAEKRSYAQALDLIAALEKQRPQEQRLLDEKADILMASGERERALAIRRELLQQHPDDARLRLDLARALHKAGRDAQAVAAVRELLEQTPSDDLATRLAAARLLTDLRQPDRDLIAQLLEVNPEHPDVLMEAGRIEQADHHYAAALAYYRRAQAAERAAAGVQEGDAAASQAQPLALELSGDLRMAQRPLAPGASDPQPFANFSDPGRVAQSLGEANTAPQPPMKLAAPRSAADAAVDEIEARRYGFITAGANRYGKSGSPGTSSYDANETAIEIRVPQGYDGHWFALIDPVRADAGVLPSVYNDAALYGKVQAFGPGSLALFPAGAEQSSSGTSVGVGYETDDLRLDIGTTPIGFPVEDIVGGIQYDGRLGDLNYNLDLARRPVTSSLLSYAGAYDPVTQEIWGGVRSSGLDARLAYYGPRFSASASAGYHHLAGKNVPGNSFLSARSGADWRVIDREDMRAYAGLGLTWWSYSKYLGEYTFGHGGYYSPQTYVSFSIPLEWTGCWGRLAYQLRGSGSVSYSRIDAADFYPGDAALQAAALGMPLPSGYSAPVYGGSSGSGTGYSLKAALEYEITPHWFVGGNLDIDRSAYYAPNFLQGYLRYDFDPQKLPIFFPPRPPRSYSRF